MSTRKRDVLQSKKDVILLALKNNKIMRAKDIFGLGISREYLSKLHEKGVVERLERGIYSLPDIELSEWYMLALAQVRIPSGVVCLLSALRFHNLTTQNPGEVWMAVGSREYIPEDSSVFVNVVRMTNKCLFLGTEDHFIDGVSVKIYNPAKTVVDCFKFRNKVGLDVAIESLKEVVSQRKATIDQIWEYAGISRMRNVIRPYMEALL